MSAAAPEISVVIPCLNEEEAVGKVVDQALEGIRRSGRTGEVIVVDNASTDRSAEVAAEHGATVVREERPGYGSAYLAGLAVAQGDFIVMGDADETYPMQDLAPFVERLAEGDDLVMGSRFEGTIHGEAMPWLNRHIGNPILTGLLNVLFGVKISDAHCGMRAVRKDALPTLDLHSTGMEFASEMVFKAFRRKLRVSEIPIDYYPRVGESKLNRFGDAWRHVKFMLLYSPSWLYFVPGLTLLVLGILGALALAAGPVEVLGRTWQIHTLFLLMFAILLGMQVVQLGDLRARVRRGPPRRDRPARRAGPRPAAARARPRGRRAPTARRRRDAARDLRQLGDRRLRRALPRVRDRDRLHARRTRPPGDPWLLLPEPADDAHDRSLPGDDRRARPGRVTDTSRQSSSPRRGDLGRHPRQERRRRPDALPGRHRGAADRRGGRDRRRRLGLDRRQRRASLGRPARSSTEIPPEEFGHGRTRNLGVQPRRRRAGRLHVPGRGRPGRRLACAPRRSRALGRRRRGAYGRQLPHPDARPPERFFLDFIYGPGTPGQRLEPGAELTFETTLFSNVNAAIPRAILERYRFRDDLTMSEDQEWSRRVLRDGHSLVYEPRAAVRHSHAYTVRSAFRRFFDSGVSAEHAYVEGDESRAALRRAGARYAREELAWLWNAGHRRWIPYTAVYELGKFAGLQLGLRHRRLPRSVRRRLSSYPV